MAALLLLKYGAVLLMPRRPGTSNFSQSSLAPARQRSRSGGRGRDRTTCGERCPRLKGVPAGPGVATDNSIGVGAGIARELRRARREYEARRPGQRDADID